MQYCTLCALLCSSLLVLSPLFADDLEQPREWTSSEGTTMIATLIDLDKAKQTAMMRRNDGLEFSIEWIRLSEADQRLLQEKSETSPAEVLKDPPKLPTSFKLRKVPMVKQKGAYCVPASATMIAAYHDIETDQNQLAELSSEASASNQGTYPSDMLLAMQKLGFKGRSMVWKDAGEFNTVALPAIRRTLFETGPIYISFRPGVFGSMGHGCVITGYDDRREELYFNNPWGNKFDLAYEAVAVQGFGVVFIDPPQANPVASDRLIQSIQQLIPKFDGDILQVCQRLGAVGQAYELQWCSRRDARDDKRFASSTARRDGRMILGLAFDRNPAVILPCSPKGQTQSYFFVRRSPDSTSRFFVRTITEDGWGPEEIKTLGYFTRDWATSFIVPDHDEPIWELPMIELSEGK